jgi:O-antigen/teichoic acid export membrane protein
MTLLTRASVSSIRQMLQGSSILFIAMMVVNGLNYAYTLLLGRLMGPNDYGAYASFISLFLIMALLPMTLQQVTAKFTASGESVIAYTSRLGFWLGSAVGIVLFLLSGPLSSLVHLPQIWLIGIALFLPIYALLGALRGETQGKQHFSHLGLNLVLEHGVKIMMTPLAMVVAPLASGAVLATLATSPIPLIQLRRYLKSSGLSAHLRHKIKRYALPIFVSLLAQVVINNSDVLMVNALFDQETAGIYAAIALIGRAVFYGSWAVSAAVFPMVAARQGSTLTLLNWALISVACVGLSITVFCTFMPNVIIGILFGNAYLAGVHLIAPYAFMTTLYALANVVSNHYLASGSHRAGYVPLVGAFLQVALIILFHGSSLQVIWAQMAAQSILLALLLTGAYTGWLEKGNVHVLS